MSPTQILFISGSRSISTLPPQVLAYLGGLEKTHPIAVGDCPEGVDRLVQDYLHGAGYTNVTVYHIGERPRYARYPSVSVPGTSYTTKDYRMAELATVALAVWDGRSQGTARNIEQLNARKVQVTVIRTDKGGVDTKRPIKNGANVRPGEVPVTDNMTNAKTNNKSESTPIKEHTAPVNSPITKEVVMISPKSTGKLPAHLPAMPKGQGSRDQLQLQELVWSLLRSKDPGATYLPFGGDEMPLVDLTREELYQFFMLFRELKGNYNHPERGSINPVMLEGTPDRYTVSFVDYVYRVSDMGVLSASGRRLQNVVVVGNGNEPVLLSPYGWFASLVCQEAWMLYTSPAKFGGWVADNGFLSTKSGEGGGVYDADRARWETGVVVAVTYNYETQQFEKAKKSIYAEELFNRFGFGTIMNGDFMMGSRVAEKTADGVVFQSNKTAKAVKRLSQQHPVVCDVTGAAMKRSVRLWTEGDTAPSHNVVNAKVAIAPTLVFSPGGIIRLRETDTRIVNTIKWTVVPPAAAVGVAMTKVLPPEGQQGWEKGDVYLQYEATKADGTVYTYQLVAPQRFDTFEHKVSATRKGDKLKLRIAVVAQREERELKFRGQLKGLATYAHVECDLDAEYVITADANKSFDSLLAYDYLCQTAFENPQDAFCTGLRDRMVALNQQLGSDVTDYAVLDKAVWAEYEAMLREFFAHFGRAVWYTFECAPEYADAMWRLRVTEDGQPIDGWQMLADGSVADGDPADPRTNIMAVDGCVFRQRAFTLTAKDGAEVIWPVKVEYSTVEQSVGTQRVSTSQLIAAVEQYPELLPWANAQNEALRLRAELVLTFYGRRQCVAYDPAAHLVDLGGTLEQVVEQLPEYLLLTAVKGNDSVRIELYLPGIVAIGGDGMEGSAADLLRELLDPALDQNERYVLIRRLRGALMALTSSQGYFKGCYGPKAAVAKVMGLPHIPLAEVWVKLPAAVQVNGKAKVTRQSPALILQRLAKDAGAKRLDGCPVLLGRSPMAVMAPLTVKVIKPGHPDYDKLDTNLWYVNSLVSAWNGGDYDGDNNILIPCLVDGQVPAAFKGMTYGDLLNSMVVRTGSDQLAQQVGDKVEHGGKYLGDWYEAKSIAKLLKKRQWASFVKTEEEACKLFLESEVQQTEDVGLAYNAAFLFMVAAGGERVQALFDFYEEILGGYNPEIRALMARRETQPPTASDWASVGVPPILNNVIGKALAKAADKKATTFGVGVLAASRGNVKLALACNHGTGWVGDMFDRYCALVTEAFRTQVNFSHSAAPDEDWSGYEDA